MSTREELDTAIVDAVDTYKKAKREELVRAVGAARDARSAAEDALYSSCTALYEFDKENT